jgi:hypothetical protein
LFGLGGANWFGFLEKGGKIKESRWWVSAKDLFGVL